MLWYEGNIAEAIQKAKKEGAVFGVAIFGEDEGSKQLEEALNHSDVQKTLEKGKYVCIRITANSPEHQQFSQIYSNAPAPSIYLIGNIGQSLEVVASPMAPTELTKTFTLAWNKHSTPQAGQATGTGTNTHAASVVSAALQQASAAVAAAGASTAGASTSTQQALSNANEAVRQAEEAADQSNLSMEDKISRAHQLAAAKRQQKIAQEAEDERQRERERREQGKGVAELKRWQEEQEAKLLVEQRKKEKKDDEDLRKRVKEQIAQDRAARNARTNVSFLTEGPTDPNQPPPVSGRPAGISAAAAPVNYAGKARLQFRLPGGSSVSQVFEPELTLGDARTFLVSNNHVPFRQFTLSVAYPRRQFDSSEYGTSFRDLGLVPSAALLVLPVSGSTSSISGLGGGSSLRDWFSIILGYLFIPFTFIYSLFQRALLPPPTPATDPRNPRNRQPSQQSETNPSTSSSTQPTSRNAPAGGDASSTQARNRKANKGENSKTPDGNIHRLRNQEGDSEDENGTWNGNSTQQM